MTQPHDDGYISDYLIHWTGKNGDEDGARTLNLIVSSLRLLLSYNRIHIFDLTHEIHEKMVCFTDVPLRHSSEHCKRYGRFGIAFHKLKLIKKGAQPVFYASHSCKRDMDTIFTFLKEQLRDLTIPTDVFRALHRHFYFVQRLSDGRADARDTFYYEREWRLGEQTLLNEEQCSRDNPKYRAVQEGYPPYLGKLVTEDKKNYFEFEADDVAFLIVPADYAENIENAHGFPIGTYENVV
jgi:hypothetical protein